MSNLFALFDEPSETPQAQPLMMTDEQRTTVRALFAELGITTAREQFAVIAELTGTHISAVTELQASTAHRAILGLRRRLDAVGQVRTGNAWDDRESPTWIDQL